MNQEAFEIFEAAQVETHQQEAGDVFGEGVYIKNCPKLFSV